MKYRFSTLMCSLVFLFSGIVYADNTPVNPSSVFIAARGTAWIEQGNKNAPHRAYLLLEPNCYYCHLLYQHLMPNVKSGQLSLRIIMAAFMRPSSMGKAAAMLDSPQPAMAVMINELKYNRAADEGGLPGKSQISAKTRSKIKRNNGFVGRFDFGTPVMVYQDTDSKHHLIQGLISSSQIESELQHMSAQF